MNKLMTVLLASFLFISCDTEESVKSDLELLQMQRTSMRLELKKLRKDCDFNRSEVSNLTEKLRELKMYEEGKTPKYIIKIQLSQSHFTLDLDAHIKDALNEIEFEIPVDRDFYHSLKVGSKIVDKLRVGSLILYGSFGSWEMKVIGKQIK